MPMEFRHIFTRDILADAVLTTAYAFCLKEVTHLPSTVLIKGEYFDLRAFEIVVSYDDAVRELGASKATFLEKIHVLERLRRVRTRVFEEFVRIEFIGLSFPINPTIDQKDPESNTIPVPFAKWKESDLGDVERRYSTKYPETVRTVLKDFAEVVKDRSLQEIGIVEYNQYVEMLKARRLENGSINDYTRALKASFGRAVSRGFLAQNPFKGNKPLPERKRYPIIIEPEEYARLREACPYEWLRSMFDFNLLTGFRRAEVVYLTWPKIDFERRVISIRHSEGFSPKQGREREIPLVPETEALLSKVRQDQVYKGIDQERVFVDDEGKPISCDRFTKAFKKAARFAGLREELTLHALRRTTATKLKQKRASTHTVMGFLGHGYERTTNRYLGIPSEDIADALAKVSLKDFLPSQSTGKNLFATGE